MVKDDRKTNPSFIAFFKLFLFDLKVEIMLISWHFFMALCIHPPLLPPPPLKCHPHFPANGRCRGGTYLGQVSFTCDI